MPDQTPAPEQEHQGAPRPRTRHRPALLSYLVVLFGAAFLLMLLSYFMQQRRSDQSVISGLQENLSAMQTTTFLIEQNQELQAKCEQLQAQIDALTDEQTLLNTALTDQRGEFARLEEALQEQENTTLALDWLWRIEREYFQGRKNSARTLIRAFEETGLAEYLPDQSLVDEEYRSPAFQYQAIYDVLF